MSDNATPDGQKKKVMWILWGALLWSLAIYTFIVLVTKGGKGLPKNDPATLQTMLIGLGAAALMTMATIFFVLPKILIKPGRNSKVSMGGYFTYSILRWAMAEAVCIFGLVYFFLGGSPNVYFAFLACSALIFLLTAPTQRDQESYDRAADEQS